MYDKIHYNLKKKSEKKKKKKEHLDINVEDTGNPHGL